MRALAYVSALMLLFAVAAPTSTIGQPTSPAQETKPNKAIASVAEIERDLATNSPASTEHLIQALESLRSEDLYYLCALSEVTVEERLKGSPKSDTFLAQWAAIDVLRSSTT